MSKEKNTTTVDEFFKALDDENVCAHHYSINVSRYGRHFFATTDHSLMTERDTRAMMEIFVEKFPKSEGYEIMINAHIEYAHYVSYIFAYIKN